METSAYSFSCTAYNDLFHREGDLPRHLLSVGAEALNELVKGLHGTPDHLLQNPFTSLAENTLTLVILLSSYRNDFCFFSTAKTTPFLALMPMEGAPAATACRAYSI